MSLGMISSKKLLNSGALFAPPKWTFPSAMLSIRKNKASARDVRNGFSKWKTIQYINPIWTFHQTKGIVFFFCVSCFPPLFPIVPVNFSIIFTRRPVGPVVRRWWRAMNGPSNKWSWWIFTKDKRKHFPRTGVWLQAKISPLKELHQYR